MGNRNSSGRGVLMTGNFAVKWYGMGGGGVLYNSPYLHPSSVIETDFTELL